MATENPEMTDHPDRARRPAGVGEEDAPTQQLVAATLGDRCVNCGVPLSSDQRYCVNCGERRGKLRFALPTAPAAVTEVSQTRRSAWRRGPSSDRPRVSSGATLVAGVGTLLLAMGVGVLIGHTSGTPKQAAAPPVQVVSVGGGSGSGGTTTAGTTATKSGKKGGKGGSHSKSKSKASAAGAPPAAVAAKASNAASKVLGGSKNLPPATVTVGQQGHGPGFNKSGQFDGSFFGN
jgi:hypothetical protein